MKVGMMVRPILLSAFVFHSLAFIMALTRTSLRLAAQIQVREPPHSKRHSESRTGEDEVNPHVQHSPC